MNFKIARVGKHFWEEPVLSGERGSGTIFFSGCVLRCAYCQNYEISRGAKGLSVTGEQLIRLMLYLEESGAHNINLVTPTHYAKALPYVLEKAKQRLKIPIVYNCGGYERIEDLKNLSGLVDIYLPDFKYCSAELSEKYSGVKDYVMVAIAALAEMRDQQKKDILKKGILQNGVIVRHLILPGQAADSFCILEEIARIDKTLYVSLMTQYFPVKGIYARFPELDARVTESEYSAVCDRFFEVGLKNGFTQEPDSATEDYVPKFDLDALRGLIESIGE